MSRHGARAAACLGSAAAAVVVLSLAGASASATPAVSSTAGGVGTSSSADSAQPGVLRISIVGGNQRYVSPNGDGRNDVARVRYRVNASAEVVARIVRPSTGDRVRTMRLGKQTAGDHRLRWNGRDNRGHRLTDGSYDLVLRAVGSSGRHHASTRVAVDTTKPSLKTSHNRTTVYPRTTLFSDVVRYQYAPEVTELHASVRTRSGRLLRRLSPEQVPCANDFGEVVTCRMVTWDGRNSGGQVVAAGTALLRAVAFDVAGNRRAGDSPVVVSPEPLVEHTTVATLPARKWPSSARCGPGSGNGCGETSCPPVPSERFADGLSFRADPGCSPAGHESNYSFAVPGGGETGHERYRVTAVGGPTTPAGTDTAHLGQVAMQGEGSFTTPWYDMTLDPTHTLDAVRAVGTWSVYTAEPNRYDVATFTVERTYFAPRA